MKTATRVKKIEKMLAKKAPEVMELVQIRDEDLLGSGYVVLDVACSGRVKGGYGKGLLIKIVGDSSSGKTWLSQTCLGEAARNPAFKDYEFFYDNIERGNMINTRRFFGKEVARRLKPPAGTRKSPIYSTTVEDLYYTLYKLLKAGKRFIYIVDSMDGLDTIADDEKFNEQMKAHQKGKVVSGSYAMSKAKQNSTNLRRIIPLLEKTGSIVIIIHQTRDSVGFGFEDKTHSGGRAPKFYAHLELWTSIVKKIKKKVMGKDRHIGTVIKIDIKKNRLTGWEGKIEMPFYKNYGVDNIGGCVDYLVSEGHWKKSSGGINATEFGVKLTRENLIHHIEEKDLEKKLAIFVKKTFHRILALSTPVRKRRYE